MGSAVRYTKDGLHGHPEYWMRPLCLMNKNLIRRWFPVVHECFLWDNRGETISNRPASQPSHDPVQGLPERDPFHHRTQWSPVLRRPPIVLPYSSAMRMLLSPAIQAPVGRTCPEASGRTVCPSQEASGTVPLGLSGTMSCMSFPLIPSTLNLGVWFVRSRKGLSAFVW